jgi:hypothetical protein
MGFGCEPLPPDRYGRTGGSLYKAEAKLHLSPTPHKLKKLDQPYQITEKKRLAAGSATQDGKKVRTVAKKGKPLASARQCLSHALG